jgi:hypothetical protein
MRASSTKGSPTVSRLSRSKSIRPDLAFAGPVEAVFVVSIPTVNSSKLAAASIGLYFLSISVNSRRHRPNGAMPHYNNRADRRQTLFHRSATGFYPISS